LLSVSDVVQVEKSALATYVECHEDLIMTKVRQHLFKEENIYTTKAVVVDKHIAQWYSKALHGQDYYLREVFSLLLGLERHILTLLQRR